MISSPCQECARWFPRNMVDEQTSPTAIKQMRSAELTLIRIDFESIKPLSQQRQCKQSH